MTHPGEAPAALECYVVISLFISNLQEARTHVHRSPNYFTTSRQVREGLFHHVGDLLAILVLPEPPPLRVLHLLGDEVCARAQLSLELHPHGAAGLKSQSPERPEVTQDGEHGVVVVVVATAAAAAAVTAATSPATAGTAAGAAAAAVTVAVTATTAAATAAATAASTAAAAFTSTAAAAATSTAAAAAAAAAAASGGSGGLALTLAAAALGGRGGGVLLRRWIKEQINERGTDQRRGTRTAGRR
jgi:hypothetical protein